MSGDLPELPNRCRAAVAGSLTFCELSYPNKTCVLPHRPPLAVVTTSHSGNNPAGYQFPASDYVNLTAAKSPAAYTLYGHLNSSFDTNQSPSFGYDE